MGDSDEGLLACIVRNADDAILSKDLNGTVTSWNRSCELLYGYSAEEMVGRSIFDIIPDSEKGKLAEVLEQVHLGNPVRHFETLRQRKTGETFLVSLTVSPIHGEGGDVIGSSSIIRDITRERARADNLAQQMVELFESVQALMNHVLPVAKELQRKGFPQDF